MKPTFKSHHILLLAMALCSSCASINNGPTTYRYAQAMAGGPILYQPKPMSSDTSKTANFISVGISNNFQSKTNVSDELILLNLMYQRGHTAENFSYGYGGYLFLGNYSNYTTQSGPVNGQNQVGNAYFGSKGFYGYGLQSSICFLTTAGNIDFRFLGAELNYSNESGDYLDYRKYASTQPYIYTDLSSGSLKAGLTSEVIFHSRRNASNQYGFRIYYGTSIGSHNYLNSSAVTPGVNGSTPYSDNALAFSFFLQHHRYFLTFNGTENCVMYTLGYRF